MRYLISFGARAMDHIAEEDMPGVAMAARSVCQEAIDAGVFVLAGGLEDKPAALVAVDGTVSGGRMPEAISGIMVIDVASRQEALGWAAKVAGACRCAQEVWEIGLDPELDAMLRGMDP